MSILGAMHQPWCNLAPFYSYVHYLHTVVEFLWKRIRLKWGNWFGKKRGCGALVSGTTYPSHLEPAPRLALRELRKGSGLNCGFTTERTRHGALSESGRTGMERREVFNVRPGGATGLVRLTHPSDHDTHGSGHC